MKNIKWAIYLTLFALPSYQIRFEVLHLPMSLLEGMILILAVVWVLKKGYRELYFLKDFKGLVVLIGIFLVVATISIFVGPDRQAAAGIWKAYFIEPVIFFLIFVSTIKKKDLDSIFKVFFWQVLVLGVVGLYQKISGDLIPNPFWAAEETRRIVSVFAYPNALELYITPLVLIFMGIWALRAKENIKGILNREDCLLIIGLGLAAILFSGSKGAMIAILAGLVFYVIFFKNYRKYVLILLIALAVFGFIATHGKINLKGTSTVEGGDSISTRLDMWSETASMLKERPILGAGLSGYPRAVEPYHEKSYIEIYLYPHNIFLNFWTEIGVAGMLSFFGIVSYFYFYSFRLKGNERYLLMAAMTGLFIHGLVDVPYFKNDLSIIFFVIIGMMIVLNKDKAMEIE